MSPRWNERHEFSSIGESAAKANSWKREIEEEKSKTRERKKSESDPNTQVREDSKGVAVYFQIVRPAKGINVGAKTAHPCRFPAPLPPTEKVTMSSRLYIPFLVSIYVVWAVYARKKTRIA